MSTTNKKRRLRALLALAHDQAGLPEGDLALQRARDMLDADPALRSIYTRAMVYDELRRATNTPPPPTTKPRRNRPRRTKRTMPTEALASFRRAQALTARRCAHCSGTIPCGAQIVNVKGRGSWHLHCFEEDYR